MAREDLAQCDGLITDLIGGGIYKVELANGVHVNTKLCGKMKRFRIRVVIGDKVTVGLSPYDPTHGLILQRHKS